MKFIRSSQQLGNVLRVARKQLGLTQPQLALAAGVGVRAIVELEAGKPTLRLEHVLRVIDALGGEVQLSGLQAVAADDQREGVVRELAVWLFADHVGTLAMVDGRLTFCYAPGWLSRQNAVALSASLPLQAEPFDDRGPRRSQQGSDKTAYSGGGKGAASCCTQASIGAGTRFFRKCRR